MIELRNRTPEYIAPEHIPHSPFPGLDCLLPAPLHVGIPDNQETGRALPVSLDARLPAVVQCHCGHTGAAAGLADL